MNLWNHVAEAYSKIGDAANAKRILDSFPSTSKFLSSLKYMAIKPDILELNGDLTGALTAYRNFSMTIDSIHQNIFSHDLLFAQKRHKMERTNLLEIQKKEKIVWLSLVYSICVADYYRIYLLPV